MLFFLWSSVLSREWLRQISDGHMSLDSPAVEVATLPPNPGQPAPESCQTRDCSRGDAVPGLWAQPETASSFHMGALGSRLASTPEPSIRMRDHMESPESTGTTGPSRHGLPKQQGLKVSCQHSHQANIVTIHIPVTDSSRCMRSGQVTQTSSEQIPDPQVRMVWG